MNLSIIVPNYNGGNFLLEGLESLSKDLCDDDEIIIVDDSSTDNSISLIKEFQEKNHLKINFILRETNSGGPARPRNMGIDRAKNEIICFFDSDDIWLKGRRSIIIETFKATDPDAVFTKIFDASKICITKVREVNNFTSLSRLRIGFLNELKLSSSAIKKEIVLKHRFNEEKKFTAVEDFYLWLKISKTHKIVLNHSKTIWYRRHDANISKNKIKQAIKVQKVLSAEFRLWPIFFVFYTLRGLINTTLGFLIKL